MAPTTPATTAAPSTDPATSVPATDPATHDTAGEHTQPLVRVGLVDYAFGGLPASVPAGTRLSVTNTSETELHELLAFRLPDGEQRPLDELLRLAPEEFESIVGHPSMVLIARPGQDGVVALGDGTLTEPGRYVIMCAIPVGADPDEYLAAAAEAAESGQPPQVAGGPPHFTQGMVAELSVER